MCHWILKLYCLLYKLYKYAKMEGHLDYELVGSLQSLNLIS
jgi:hypothetical protein